MPFQVHSWPNVILHLDGDSFFVSVLQAINPSLKGKPVVAGSERGIATAMSYEAKKYGVTRAMPIDQVKKLCPQCIVLHSDYETYSLFSKKMFAIMREFSPLVEEYSIDEGFADLKGLRRPLNMTYYEIGEAIKNKIESSLGISVSVGISLTKSLAKLASSSSKPSGLKLVKGLDIADFLKKIPIGDVWGIGENTSAYCKKLGIQTAFDLLIKDEDYIIRNFNKSIREIWQELKGEVVYKLDSAKRTTYQSIQRTESFRPPTNNPDLLWGRLMEHVEDAFSTARRYRYSIGKVSIFLKTQEFRYHSTEIKFIERVSYPILVKDVMKKGFKKIWTKGILYRTTGCSILDLAEEGEKQQSLFTDINKEAIAKKIYPLIESNKLSFASSLFDKTRSISSKRKPKSSIPILSLNSN